MSTETENGTPYIPYILGSYKSDNERRRKK